MLEKARSPLEQATKAKELQVLSDSPCSCVSKCQCPRLAKASWIMSRQDHAILQPSWPSNMLTSIELFIKRSERRRTNRCFSRLSKKRGSFSRLGTGKSIGCRRWRATLSGLRSGRWPLWLKEGSPPIGVTRQFSSYLLGVCWRSMESNDDAYRGDG